MSSKYIRLKSILLNAIKEDFSRPEATSGNTLMEELRDNRYEDIEAMCDGVCFCASCQAFLLRVVGL